MFPRWPWLLALAPLALLPLARGQPPAPRVVWIYSGRLDRAPSERAWAPFGFFPAEAARAGAINVNATCPVDKRGAAGGTCIEYLFRLEEATDFAGAFHLLKNGTAWGTEKEAPDLERVLGVGPDDLLVLRFRAKGTGVVSFRMGGVDTGPFPSSMPVARAVRGSPVELDSATFRDYSIGPFPAREARRCIDPFMAQASGMDNPGRRVVRVYVTAIRVERWVPER